MSHKFGGLSLRRQRHIGQQPEIQFKISAPIAVTESTNPAVPSTGPGAASSSSSHIPTNLQAPAAPGQLGPGDEDMRFELKRRHSARITERGLEYGAGSLSRGLPGLPPIPDQYRTGRDESGERPPADPRGIGVRSASGNRPGTSRSDHQTAASQVDIAQVVKHDAEHFREPDFNAGLYVSERLGNYTGPEINMFREELNEVRKRTSSVQQQGVYRDRGHFIKISKEVERVTEEMRSIRGLISELNEAIGSTSSSEPAAPIGGSQSIDAARRAMNRSSVANQEALWNSYMQVLWKRVEGSQKLLPAIPGRHIVYESGLWKELNAATWRPSHKVHIVLLNDHLLIAVEKKRMNGPDREADREKDREKDRDPSQPSHVARHCWPLQAVQIADISIRPAGARDRAAVTEAISIRVGPDTHTYAVGDQYRGEKANLLGTFRKAAEAHRKMREKYGHDGGADDIAAAAAADLTGSSMMARSSMLVSTPTTISSMSAAVTAAMMTGKPGDGNQLNTKAGSKLMSSSLMADSFLDFSSTLSQQIGPTVRADGASVEVEHLDRRMNEIDMEIELHQFEPAVSHIESFRHVAKAVEGTDVVAKKLMIGMVDARVRRVADLVTKVLVDQNSKEDKVSPAVGWLVRLGCGTVAKDAFLSVRTDLIRKRSKQCIFDGDMHMYIFQITYVYFTMIRNTIRLFRRCFISPAAATTTRDTDSSLLDSTTTITPAAGKQDPSSSQSTNPAVVYPNMSMSTVIAWAHDHVDDLIALLTTQLASVEKGGQVWDRCVETVRQNGEIVDSAGTEFGRIVFIAVAGEGGGGNGGNGSGGAVDRMPSRDRDRDRGAG